MAGAYEVDEIKIGHYEYDLVVGYSGNTDFRGTYTVGESTTSIVYPNHAGHMSNWNNLTRLKYTANGSQSTRFSRMSNGYIMQKSKLPYAAEVYYPSLNPDTMSDPMPIEFGGTISGAQYRCVWADNDGSESNPEGNAVTYTRNLNDKRYNDAGGYFGYPYTFAKSSSYYAQNNTVSYISGESLSYMHVFFIPTGTVSTVTVTNGRSTGVITDLGVIKVRANVADTLHIILDGAELGTMDVQANVDTVVPLGSYSGQISKNTTHTLQLRSNYNGYLTEDKTTFILMDAGIEVTGKPQAVERRPTACSLVTITDIPAGATAVWQVTNNANDDNPSWEIYEGDSHVFENTEAASGKFALGWKVNVDAGTATTQPKITEKVGMGVLYDESD